VSATRDVVAILAIALGAWFSVRVFLRFSPLLALRISPRWVDEDKTLLLIGLELRNQSRVRADRPEVFLQVVEHAIPTGGGSISEWVAFDEETRERDAPVLDPREPVRVFEGTDRIYPGEVIAIERLHHCPQEEVVFHLGLQVRHEPRRRFGLWGPPPQTTTCIVTRCHAPTVGGISSVG
jgi:hypothetical protein